MYIGKLVSMNELKCIQNLWEIIHIDMYVYIYMCVYIDVALPHSRVMLTALFQLPTTKGTICCGVEFT